jgi:hypothetical protein
MYLPCRWEELTSIPGGDMKNHVGALALLLPLALAGAGSARAAEVGAAPDAPAERSEATLRGTCLFATNGFIVGGKGKGPFAAGGYEVHDGHGHTRQIVSYSIDGKITRFERGTGKVTVNADCTGTAVYTDGTHYDLFIAPDGGTIVLFETDPGTVSAEVEPRVTARRVGD